MLSCLLLLICSLQFTESQSGWGWKGPLEDHLVQLLLKQGHLKPNAQEEHVQMAFEYPSTETPQSLDNVCHCSVILTIKKTPNSARGLCSCHWAPLRIVWLCSHWTFSSGIICTLIKFTQAFSSPGWTGPALSFSPAAHHWTLSTNTMLLYWGAQTGHSTPDMKCIPGILGLYFPNP